jgi:serine/threonine protein kinase
MPVTTTEPGSLVGSVLNGRYVVERELRRGGFGIVYFARDRQLHLRPVVVKVLLKDAYESEYIVLKFRQEVEALSRIDHPGVVGIIDSGTLSDGKPFIVMQYVDGVTLRSILKAEGMELERAAELIKQIGRALTAAHEKRILHRDLKPENIMLQSYGSGEEQVKIIDFGIAKLKDSIIGPSTVSGTTAGTVSYMAPEQLSGKPLSAAMDIFAMGAIAYELLTGRRPFNPETGFDLLELQRSGVKAKPSDLRPALSDETSEVILRALSFDPHLRFQNAREFGDVLARSLSENHTAFDPLRTIQAPIVVSQIDTVAQAPPRATGDLSSKTIAVGYQAVESILTEPSSTLVIKNKSKSRISRRIAIALIALAFIGVAAAVLIWKRDTIFGSRNSAAAAERAVAYSLTVQKMRNGKPYQGEFESSGQEIFENGWKFRVNLASPQDGYLYLLNEGPANGGAVTYNVLFPESQTNGGSPRVSANQKLQTAWMRFDDNQGTEKFWMVWSPAPVKELEAVNDAANDKDRGEIRDAAKSKSVRDFLSSHSSQKPDVTKDSVKKQTIVSGKSDVLVNLIELEHH